MSSSNQLHKSELRQQAKAARGALADRAARSVAVFGHLSLCAEFQSARTILFYVSARTELETVPALATALAAGRSIAVPYCVGDELQMFRLQAMSELVPGAFGILEPAAELRELTPRQVLPSQIDLALVPGVVFDRQGNRLGYGRGFYDRLLRLLRRDVLRVGLAFECQVVEELPVEPHDERMDWLVTEAGVRRFAAG